MFYTVRETALKLGIPSSKIRFYDKKGLLPFIERSPNGVRIFTEGDVAHLQDLLVLKDSGFSLKELAEYVKLEAEGERSVIRRLEMLEQRYNEVGSEIARLQGVLEILEKQRQGCIAMLEHQANL